MPTDDPTQTEKPPPLPDASAHLPFPVVGVGASAGGLEALTDLFQALPPDPGMAFLLVLHLQANVKSHMPEVLARHTGMRVVEATEDMPVESNCIHLIPPNKSMALTDGKLALQPRPPFGLHMPIDYLFRSLADVQKSRAIGVLLSGEGTDGTLGFHSIKAAGGVTFAQDDKTAKHDAMPRSAVNDGSVDYVLSPQQIARELLRLHSHPYTQGPITEAEATAHELARVNNDLVNLLSGVNIPIVMVGRDLRVHRFTPLAEKVFNLIPTDTGRPISDIKPNLRGDDMAGMITRVIDTLAPHESEVQDKDGHWYSLRIRPYVTLENRIDGASIVLLDIDTIKRTLDRLQKGGKG
jgi:hypothetical protein